MATFAALAKKFPQKFIQYKLKVAGLGDIAKIST